MGVLSWQSTIYIIIPYVHFRIVILIILSAIYICYVQFFRRGQLRTRTMEFFHFINLIFIFALNVLFFFSGICLNSMVVLSFWRSVQLRKKLCNFMIMGSSCCDLLVVLTSHPLTALTAILFLTGKLDVYTGWLVISSRFTGVFVGFSILALLVMNFDRYLATYYPIFHRTSVTKGRLLTLLAILITVEVTLLLISFNDFVITYQVGLLIFFIIIFLPMLFINYKLFTIARKSRRNKRISPKMKKTFSLKNVSSCIACWQSLVL